MTNATKKAGELRSVSYIPHISNFYGDFALSLLHEVPYSYHLYYYCCCCCHYDYT